MLRVEKIIDAVQKLTGHIAAGLTLLMVAMVAYNVVARYVFNTGVIALQELEWYFFSAAFLIGAGYVLKEDAHVRIDIFYANMSPKSRAVVNLIGCLLFLLPFCALMAYHSWKFADYSYSIAERSSDPGGLPETFIIKAAIPTSFIVLFLSGISVVLRSIRILQGDTTSSSTLAQDALKADL